MLGRKELDPLTGGDATEELILLTMLPMPIQKAMVSPVNRPTMAPCPETQPTLLSQGPPQTSIPVPRTAERPTVQVHPHAYLGSQVSLTRGLAHGKNIPRQKSPSSGPPTMPKMLSAAWSRWKEKRKHRLRDVSLNVLSITSCWFLQGGKGCGDALWAEAEL